MRFGRKVCFLPVSYTHLDVYKRQGKAFYAMIGLTAGGVLNIFGDFFLIRVFPLGVLGAGISTAVSQFVSFIILFFWYSRMAQGTISLR